MAKTIQMKAQKKQGLTYQITRISIEALLFVSSINGVLSSATLLLAFDGGSNIISLFFMFIGGFIRIFGQGILANILCGIMVVTLAIVIGFAILVMNMQPITYKENGKRPAIHKAGLILSVISGILSAAGYLEMVTTLNSSIITMGFHCLMAVTISVAIPVAYNALSKHAHKQYGNVIATFTKKTLDIASDVSIKSFASFGTQEGNAIESDSKSDLDKIKDLLAS